MSLTTLCSRYKTLQPKAQKLGIKSQIILSLFSFFNFTGVAVSAGDVFLLVQQNYVAQSPDADAETQEKSFSVRAQTIVLGIQAEKHKKTNEAGWLIKTTDGSNAIGWLPAHVVHPVTQHVTELQAEALVKNRSQDEIPDLIWIKKTPAIKEAWKQVSIAIEENEKLSEQERLPDPYFSRASIWMEVGDPANALHDYLKGLQIARKTSAGVGRRDYTEIYTRISRLLDQILREPIPATGRSIESQETAKTLFGQGISAFHAGDHASAIQRFDTATALIPNEPAFWYYRAAANRKIGDFERAKHDAVVGAHMEKSFKSAKRREITRALIRLQGEDRMWLESYRLGSPADRELPSLNDKRPAK